MRSFNLELCRCPDDCSLAGLFGAIEQRRVEVEDQERADGNDVQAGFADVEVQVERATGEMFIAADGVFEVTVFGKHPSQNPRLSEARSVGHPPIQPAIFLTLPRSAPPGPPEWGSVYGPMRASSPNWERSAVRKVVTSTRALRMVRMSRPAGTYFRSVSSHR